MLIRRETAADVDAIRAVTARAFTAPAVANTTAANTTAANTFDTAGLPAEARLVDELRADPGWIPELSLVAEVDGAVVGHVVCTRGSVAGRPALGLGPLSVDPPHQGRGVGSALLHAVVGGADARDEPVVVLLGAVGYYRRFGFVLAERYGIEPPDPAWRPHFQVRTLAAYPPDLTGVFRYAAPFDRL